MERKTRLRGEPGGHVSHMSHFMRPEDRNRIPAGFAVAKHRCRAFALCGMICDTSLGGSVRSTHDFLRGMGLMSVLRSIAP